MVRWSAATVVTGSLNDEPSQSGGVIKTGSGVMQLQGTDTYSAGTVVDAGTLVLGSVGALPTNSALTVNGGTAQFLNLATGNKFLAQLSALTIGGSTNAWTGKLDLSNNDLIVHSASLATVSNQVLEGYANGTWNGSAGIVSSTAAGNTTHLTAVGVVQNNQSGTALFSANNLFDGINPNAGDLLLKYTYYGDANLDGRVNSSDYTLIDAAYLANRHTPGLYTGWFNGDFNYDGVVNGSDYTLIDNAFNSQGAQITAQIANPTAEIEAGTEAKSGAVTSVPEPALGSLSAIMAAGLLRRRGKTKRMPKVTSPRQ
jgi:autotransporter-associated beta strand protein